MACLLAADFLGAAPAANATLAGQPILKPGESAGNYLLVSKRRERTRIHLPLGPAYIYYDYPYYYCRGYYPKHIGGYVYYPLSYHPRYDGQCLNSHRKCAAKGKGARKCL